MTLAVVAQLSAWGGGATTGTRVTSSFTPPANAKLYVSAYTESGTIGATTVTISSTSLSWTLIGSAGPGGSFQGVHRIWEADTGSSPAAMTITLTSGAGTAQTIDYAVVAITGSTPAIKSGQIGFGAVSTPNPYTIGPLPAAATSGNLVVSFQHGNRDLSVALTGPSGFSTLIANGGSGDYQGPAVFYSTTFTGTSTTATNPESASGNSSNGALVEFIETVIIPSVPLQQETDFLGFILDESGAPLMTE